MPDSPIRLIDSFRAVAGVLEGVDERVDITIGDGDEMYQGDLESYLGVGRSAMAAIADAMALTGRTSFDRILDLPCGHGRIGRFLHAAFPTAELVACDILGDGVDFCASQFGATPVYSQENPSEIPLEGTFDLIFVGSLLTHLDLPKCAAFLEVFRERLAPDGLLLISSHGREAVERWPTDNERLAGIRMNFLYLGFGYADHPHMRGYGTTAYSAAWLASMIAPMTDLTLLSFRERGFNDHQDLATLLKHDVHHLQGSFQHS